MKIAHQNTAVSGDDGVNYLACMTSSEPEWDRWRELIAIGLVAGDVSAETIARCAGVSRLDVIEALDTARRLGLVADDHSVSPEEATRLVADLAIDRVSRVHTDMTRHFLSLGRDGLESALRHARRVTAADDTESVIALCDHRGEVNLSLGDYRSARQLFEVAAALDLTGDDRRIAQRLIHLATAIDGEGDVLEARKLLERASALGERLGDVDLVVEAAVRHTLPVEWYAGDQHSLALLQRTERFDLSPDQAVRVAAARGLAEMRIPVLPHDGQQLAWITRPEAAQPLTQWALDHSVGLSSESRAMALLAWRSTHRSPRYLADRLRVSRELMSLTQELRRPALQVDAAVYLAADAVESADRQLYDKALGVTRWVADRDGSARLSWRADTLAAGAAHLDGDSDASQHLAQRAHQTGERINAPGWLAAVYFFQGQRAIGNDDFDAMGGLLLDESFPGMHNPLALATVSYFFARYGDFDSAYRYVRKSLRQLDFESSALFLLSRASATTLLLDEADLRREMIDLLQPWVEHVSVDSNAWWCDGPVAMWLALLHESLGELTTAHELWKTALPLASKLNDVNSLRRLRSLESRLGENRPVESRPELTDRETKVLQMLSAGATNAAIAAELNYSVSTVRNATVSVYRKLEVSGRAEAVARALTLGLLTADDIG